MEAQAKPAGSAARLSDEDLFNWAASEIGAPIGRIADIASKMGQGKRPGFGDALLKLPLSPFEVDYRCVYPLMRDLMPVLAFEPAHLLVIVLDSGSKMVSAKLVAARDNNYVSIEDLSADEEWAREAMESIRSGDLENLRHDMDERFRAKSGQTINCVIVVTPGGIAAVKDGWEEYRAGGRGYFSFLYRMLGKCFEEKSIIVEPMPRVFTRLMDVNRMVDAPEETPAKASKDESTPLKIAVGLWGRDYVSAFLYDSEKPGIAAVNADSLSRDNGPEGLAKMLRRETGASSAVVLHADMAINLAYELFNRPLPARANDTRVMLRKLIYFISGYKRTWWINPKPIFLKNYVRVPMRILGLPYDITRLSWTFLPDLIVDGIGIGVGDVVRTAVVVLDGNEPLSVTLVDTYDRGLKKITVVPAGELKAIFDGASRKPKIMREKLVDAKHLLWDKYGWVDFIAAVQQETLALGRKLLTGGYLGSPLKAPLAAPTLLKLNKSLARGGFLLYPNAVFSEFARYANATGRWKVRSNALKIPFDSYRRRPRGPLYIRETLYLAGAAAAAAALLLWIL